MTLIELTVVVLVMLSLITILLIGGHAWKRGADRALCLVNLEHVQKGVRSFANLNNLDPGDILEDLEKKVIGPDKLVQGLPKCPGGGTYVTMGDQVPKVGELYGICSLSVSHGHIPADFSGW